MKINSIFNINSEIEFEKICFEIYDFQIKSNNVYKNYATSILQNKYPSSIFEIPFLPIRFFKEKKILCDNINSEIIFKSSGTEGSKSIHYVADVEIYKNSFIKNFESFYGDISNYCILALLPSYMEQKSSSLIFMIDELINKSKHPKSGYFLNDHNKLSQTINQLESTQQKVILFGVTYALLDFAKKYSQQLKKTIIIETGGMKGRRKEITKQEVHDRLKKAFKKNHIHSEYGMTEMLSQAYSKKNNVFYTPP